ncbi:unnamed protein product [Prunus armeniaca]|uniref:Uncharacterized protein n=1 Tax=Prunus armeniaca TaxID=36596 RepID=A0A6J5TIR0_PRUAR|nr:unnamed protein product [Prunus armeniaca]CAB4294409.1 unnamed protein product [Prunus armeniaca]
MGVWRMDGVICGSVNPRMCFLQCGWENDGSLEDGWSDLWKYEFEDGEGSEKSELSMVRESPGASLLLYP